MQNIITEIQIVPIKPNNGLLAFASVVLDNNIYLGGIGIYTRPEGGYRLTYPTRKVGATSYPIYHPISKEFSDKLVLAIIGEYEEVAKPYDRHNYSATG
jgi:stage V sporulation protein G